MRRSLSTILALVLVAGCSDENTLEGFQADPYMPDAGTARSDAQLEEGPGSECDCDADCPSVEGHAGICVIGICMTRASGECAEAGSSGECAKGSRCWGLEGFEGSICWPDCSTYQCGGTCDDDGSCAPTAASSCEYSCGAVCACGEGDCATGEVCVSGQCIPDTTGEGPGPGPGPTCASLPTRDCTGTTCATVQQWSPHTTAHYDDYPINGETSANQYRSWLRKDLIMLVNYASAKTLCKAASWDTGDGGALGLGDMSEQNGAIPGTSIGQPGHPAGTHTNGRDIDLAYYQIGQTNNRLRPICPHTSGGNDQYHCTGDPTTLDIWRMAMFLGTVFESSRVRVIGVDGKVGPKLLAAIARLCDDGWLSGSSCTEVPLAFEATDMGQGWFLHHHHHAHISIKTTTSIELDPPGAECMDPGHCSPRQKPNPLLRGLFAK